MFKSRFILVLILFWSLAFSAKGQFVYKTVYGKKYHIENCATVKNPAKMVSLKEAQASGLTPCKVCHPFNNGLVLASQNKAAGVAGTVQCKGTTKKGTRCQRKTKNANKYCYQHPPK